MSNVRREWLVTADTSLSPIPGIWPEMTRVTLVGDTLRIDGPLKNVAAASNHIASHYQTLVPKDGEEGREWLRQQEEAAAVERAEREERDNRARRWLEENDVPGFVVDFLRS